VPPKTKGDYALISQHESKNPKRRKRAAWAWWCPTACYSGVQPKANSPEIFIKKTYFDTVIGFPGKNSSLAPNSGCHLDIQEA